VPAAIDAGKFRRVTRETHATADAPSAIGPYSQAVRAEGRFLFCSGQIALRPDGSLVGGDVRAQTEQVMTNIGAVLCSAGLGFANVVKTTIFLSSMDHFSAVNDVYGAHVGPNPPARSTVAVMGLPKDVDVEIEVTAVY
jgi:2-iminobutanoate/2-iminopropanoate deaminase